MDLYVVSSPRQPSASGPAPPGAGGGLSRASWSGQGTERVRQHRDSPLALGAVQLSLISNLLCEVLKSSRCYPGGEPSGSEVRAAPIVMVAMSRQLGASAEAVS